jgi:hypothetical protein
MVKNEPIQIHPYDLYELISSEPRPSVIEREGRLIEVGGILYEHTTKVPAVTKNLS